MARLRSYERFGRAEAIEKARAAGRYNGSHWVHAHELRSHADSYTAVLGSGDRVRLDSLDAAMRRRLLWSPDGQPEPLAFFLTQQGVPVADEGLWNYYFRAASRVYNRDREVADHMWVTPHMLRHSMATSLLGYLCDALLSADPDELADPANVVLARHVYDPVRELMRLLGHRRLESTYRYVHTLRRNQDAVAATVSKWDREMPT
ncbi:MAG: hypothetical protein JJU45_19115 [Acidimicrobiia bacterium]|nr:hypothetical protein [Acidimicrobiia bacterium]